MAIVPCPPNTPPVTGVVQFVFSEFAAAFPEFAGIAAPQAGAAFDSATLVLANTCRSFIRDAAKRQKLLYLLTAHVTFLRYGSNDGAGKVVPAPGVVGRVSDAAEGSVRASLEYSTTVSQSMAWFIQTTWGADYWQATAQYRTFRYAAPPASCCRVCGGVLGSCICGGTMGPTGSGFGGFNGGTA